MFIELKKVEKDLAVEKEKIHILKDISLQIEQGAFVALMGPSGSGKSTLLGIIGGIDRVDAGEVYFAGEDLAKLNEASLARIRNEKIGVVFQSFNLIPTLTALENVEVPLLVNRKYSNVKERATQLLARVGLQDRMNHLPGQLSGGQQQRVAIARALVASPALIVADEPTGSLDSKTGTQILDLFKELNTELGVTLVLATHDATIASRADTIVHLVDGRIVS